MATNSNYLLDVFGYPPDNLLPITTELIKKSMPVVEFQPCEPEFQEGLDLFQLKPAWDIYTKLLNNNEFYTPNANSIKIAFLADNFPTDSFTNEYGENFLQGLTDIASEGAASIAQMFGAKSATEVYENVEGVLQRSESNAKKTAGAGMKWLGDMAEGAMNTIQQAGSFGQTIGKSANLINKLMAGSRVDFPMVWKSSAYQPSYSFTVRLYNPNPSSVSSTKKYIVGPIVAIMLLGVPRSNSTSTFTWPFLHKIRCPGLFYLDPGFISNITIVKGGDQQQISFQNRLSIVDVRIDVGSLYSSILAGEPNVSTQRPTVKKYADVLLEEKSLSSKSSPTTIYQSLKPLAGSIANRGTDLVTNNIVNKIANPPTFLNDINTIKNTIISDVTNTVQSGIQNTVQNTIQGGVDELQRKISPKISAKVEEVEQGVTRVKQEALNKYNQLVSLF